MNFFELTYNTEDYPKMIKNILLLFSIIFLCCQTTSNFLLPVISELVKRMQLSNDLSAIIFLNIANGIPNLFTAISFSKSDAFPKISLTLGSLVTLGTIALTLVIFLSKKINYVEYYGFYKNSIMLISIYCFLIYLSAIQFISWEVCLFMLVVYISFLGYSYHASKLNVHNEIEVEDEEEGSKVDTFYSQVCRIINFSLSVILLDMQSNGSFIKKVFCIFSPCINFVIIKYFFDIRLQLMHTSFILASCIILGIFLFISKNRNNLDLFCYIYSFFASSIFLFLCSTQIINFALMIENKYRINKDLSALTFLSLATCSSDIITSAIASRKGFFMIAAYSCITAQIRNILFNLPMALLIAVIKNNFIQIFFFYKKIANVALALVPIININLVLNYEIRNRKLETELGYVLLFIYLLYIALTIIQFLTLPF